MIRRNFNHHSFSQYFSADYLIHVSNQYHYTTEIWSLNFVKLASKVNIHNLEESYDNLPSEKIHRKFCKFLIGVNKYLSNLACKSEV